MWVLFLTEGVKFRVLCEEPGTALHLLMEVRGHNIVLYVLWELYVEIFGSEISECNGANDTFILNDLGNDLQMNTANLFVLIMIMASADNYFYC